jgi:hypothetical protein
MLSGNNRGHMRKYRQNFIDIHACAVTVQTWTVRGDRAVRWSHELDGNDVSASTVGLMLGSDVAGKITGQFEKNDRG